MGRQRPRPPRDSHERRRRCPSRPRRAGNRASEPLGSDRDPQSRNASRDVNVVKAEISPWRNMIPRQRSAGNSLSRQTMRRVAVAVSPRAGSVNLVLAVRRRHWLQPPRRYSRRCQDHPSLEVLSQWIDRNLLPSVFHSVQVRRPLAHTTKIEETHCIVSTASTSPSRRRQNRSLSARLRIVAQIAPWQSSRQKSNHICWSSRPPVRPRASTMNHNRLQKRGDPRTICGSISGSQFSAGASRHGRGGKRPGVLDYLLPLLLSPQSKTSRLSGEPIETGADENSGFSPPCLEDTECGARGIESSRLLSAF